MIAECAITVNGTGDGAVLISLSFAVAGLRPVFAGSELGVSGKSVQAYAIVNSATVSVKFQEYSYPGTDGALSSIGGPCETA